MIFHIAFVADWGAAQRAGEYRMSTRDRTLEEEGFIHCSEDADQGLRVANSFYADVTEPLVVLAIDESRLDVRREPSGNEMFPHIYGPIPVAAVVRTDALQRVGAAFTWPTRLFGAGEQV